MRVAAGFSVFFEHLLPYEGMAEKGSMRGGVSVQLGGGAYNIIKTLESLGVRGGDLTLMGMTGNDSHRAGIDFLLSKEKFRRVLFPIRERSSSSYYLLPHGGKTWSLGDGGGRGFGNLLSAETGIEKEARTADVRILVEPSHHSELRILSRKLLKKNAEKQISVFIPSLSLLRGGKVQEFLGNVDCVAFNEEEGKLFFGKTPQKEDLFRRPIPSILMTRGAKGAWFKYRGNIYEAKPLKVIKNPRYVGGAGDATVAALIFSLFYKKQSPASALRFATNIGMRTLMLPTSYYFV